MSGLDKIISKIISDAQARAEFIINEANTRAAAIREQAAADASFEGERRIAAANADALAYAAQSHSAAGLETRRRLLSERNLIIDQILSEVKDSICSLPEEEYFLILKNYILSHPQNEPGIIVLNKRDLSRLPADFISSLSKGRQAPLTVSETPGNFDAGCVLIYGEVEYNGTISALINEKKDELRDLLNRELFAVQS